VCDRREEVGLSEGRYVVAKMLSRSESWARSTIGFHRGWAARGAVLERPVCERVLGVTGRAGEDGEPPSLAVFDLTDAGGEDCSGLLDLGAMKYTCQTTRKDTASGWMLD
jgi:hypothetical protein